MTGTVAPQACPEGAAETHQRADGLARLGFAKEGLKTLYQRAPCRLLFPDTPPGGAQEAVLVTTTGGLTSGDRMALEVAVGEGANATISTQAAEKLYRAVPGEAAAEISTTVTVAAGATAEWLAQEAIAFEGARFRRTLHVNLSGDARFLGVEALVLGRLAMGERFTNGLIHDAWRIRRDDRLVWADALRFEGDIAALSKDHFALGGAAALATIVYAGPDAASYLPLAREVSEGRSSGATCFDNLLFVRLVEASPAILKRRVVETLGVLRHATMGAPRALPAVWRC